MKPRRFEQHRSKSSMMCNRFSDFNVKSDKGKTPLIVLRCADNRQLFEGTGKGNGEAMKYAIYEGNIDRLEKKLKRISNKCKAYGCDFHYEQTGEEFRELKDEKGNKHTARFVLVEAEGTAIINDWEFIAELERLKKQKEEEQKEMLAQYDPFGTQNDDPDNKGDPNKGSQGGEVDE